MTHEKRHPQAKSFLEDVDNEVEEGERDLDELF